MSRSTTLSIAPSQSPKLTFIVKGNALRGAKTHRTRHDNALAIVPRKKMQALASLRHLTVTASMYITDDETFGSDEYGYATQTVSTFLSGQLPQNLLRLVKGVGGEVRVELELVAQATTSGDVLISGLAKLFEGTSESTTDLDGVRDFNILVPSNQFASFQIVIQNDDEGGDHAEIFLNCSNMSA